MNENNVIITSGSGNQIIHVPLPRSPSKNVTVSRGSNVTFTNVKGDGDIEVNFASNKSGNRDSGENTIYLQLNTSKNDDDKDDDDDDDSFQTVKTPVTRNYSRVIDQNSSSNRRSHSNEDCASDIRPIYIDDEYEEDFERNNLLLPSDGVKQEQFSDGDTMERDLELDLDDQQLADIGATKTQYMCEGCGRGFCYIGWLDRHKLSSKSCRNARTIREIRDANTSRVTKTVLNIGGDPIMDTETTERFNPKIERFRPSLAGRLDELLCCPNANCNFTTYWIQSLNKHVASTCKFNTPQQQTNVRSASPNVRSASSVSSASASASTSTKPKTTISVTSSTVLSCHICSKICADIESHIQHMSTAHNMKHHYKCSECGKSFPTKDQIESHVEEHNRNAKGSITISSTGKGYASKQINAPKSNVNGTASLNTSSVKTVLSPSVTVHSNENVDNESNKDQVWNCDCGKTYLSLRSYQIHTSSCDAVNKKTLSTPEQQQEHSNTNSDDIESNIDTPLITGLTHVKHEHIAAVHTEDSRCRNCKKEFSTTYGLCQHFSRRADCRDWYLKNLPFELQKVNYVEGSIEVSLKKQNNEMSAAKRSRLESRDSDYRTPQRISIENGGDTTKLRRASLIARSTFKLTLGNESPIDDRSKSIDSGFIKTIKCHRCQKVFSGKKPRVAYQNHLRGLRSCQPVLRRTYASQEPINHTEQLNRLSQQSDTKYYCKLCPKIEVKNRVSLGCHLTIYHGLPQVNVTTSEGDAYRCQTCSQLFVSKYFYNLHRADCDLSSPYVGILHNRREVLQSHETTSGLGFQDRYRNEMMISHDKSQNDDNDDNDDNYTSQNEHYEGNYNCEDCGRTGFFGPNAVKIHRKYQCIKRNQSISNRPNPVPFQRFVGASVKTKTIGMLKMKQPITGPGGRVYMSELAKLNDMAKVEPGLTMCDACGRGPYNSYYYFLEHKRTFCRALKRKRIENDHSNNLYDDNSIEDPRNAMKTLSQRRMLSLRNGRINDDINESIVHTTPKAKKSMALKLNHEPIAHSTLSFPTLEIDDDDNDKEAPQSLRDTFKCSVCSKECDDILLFVRHRLKHISEDLINDESSEPLDCEICGAKIAHYQRIQQHLILHLQDIKFIKQKNLIEIKHKIVKADESDDEADEHVLHCPYCKADFKTRVELANHIKNTCPFRYICAQCNKTYSTKESYLEHKEHCSKHVQSRAGSQRAAFKCLNCGLNFRRKQQLFWHHHVCAKVYRSDHSGNVEDIIQRTLTCGVCGLVSDVYEAKIKHETVCLQIYMKQIGGMDSGIIEKRTKKDAKMPPINVECDAKSVSSASQSSEIPKELIKQLKHDHGIQREVKVVLTPFDDDLVKQVKADLYLSDRDDDKQFDSLKESFIRLIRRLIKDDEFLDEISEGTSAEMLLSRMLKFLGEDPMVEANGISQLNCFRQNLQSFLKLSIKDETLTLAYKNAESVDEAIINILNFECDLH